MFQRLRNMDLILNLAVLALMAIGVYFIYSAAFSKISGVSKLFYERQLMWASVGCGLFFIFFYWDYRKLLKWAPLFYCLGVFFLFLVLLIGSRKFWVPSNHPFPNHPPEPTAILDWIKLYPAPSGSRSGFIKTSNRFFWYSFKKDHINGAMATPLIKKPINYPNGTRATKSIVKKIGR